MKHIPGTVLAVVIFAWLTFLGVGLIRGQETDSAADSYLSDVCKEISESNYAPLVIDACGIQAKTSGYDMTITLYSKSGTKVAYDYTDGMAHMTSSDEFILAEITMSYSYQIPVLGINKTHSVRGTVK